MGCISGLAFGLLLQYLCPLETLEYICNTVHLQAILATHRLATKLMGLLTSCWHTSGAQVDYHDVCLKVTVITGYMWGNWLHLFQFINCIDFGFRGIGFWLSTFWLHIQRTKAKAFCSTSIGPCIFYVLYTIVCDISATAARWWWYYLL